MLCFGDCFLAAPGFPQEERAGHLVAATVVLTDLMDTPACFLLQWSSVSPQRATPGELPSPKRGRFWSLPLTHRLSERFHQRLIRPPYLKKKN